MKNFKRIISAFIVIGIIGAILVVAGCGKSSSSSPAVKTSTYTVQKGTLLNTISAVGTIYLPNQTQLTFGTGSSTSNLFTVTEIDVAYGDSVKKGDVLAKIDTSSLKTTIEEDKINLSTAQKNLGDASSEATLLNAQAAVKNAQASLDIAEQNLTDLQTSQLTNAQTAVNDVQLALDSANLALASAKTTAINNSSNAENKITDLNNTVAADELAVADAQKTYNNYVQTNITILDREDIASQKDKYALALKKAEDTLAQDNQALAQAEDNLDAVKSQGEISIAQSQSAVTQKEAALKSAQDDLAAIESGNPDMLRAEAAVATAKANLITAQDNLDYIQAGSNTALLQIKVDNAQAQLDDDNAQLEAANIVAPYDGVVAAVYYDVGAKVSATNEIIYLVDTSQVQVKASVDEIDVASVKAGQAVEITLNAITNARLTGTVNALSPIGQTSSGVVTYPLTISVQNTGGYGLKNGMTATIAIVTLNRPDVLLVPSSAITRSGRDSVVQAINADGTTEQRTIQTGSTNGTQTEVASGLSEGEKILVTASTTSSTTSGTRTPNRAGGGGFFIGGGGGRPD